MVQPYHPRAGHSPNAGTISPSALRPPPSALNPSAAFLPGELLSLPTYRKQRFAFPFALDAALDAAVAHADAQARALGKRAAGWKAGGPAMTRVCNCTPRALLATARARHGATLVYLHRRDATAVALSLETARRSGVYVLSARTRPKPAVASAAVPAPLRLP